MATLLMVRGVGPVEGPVEIGVPMGPEGTGPPGVPEMGPDDGRRGL